MLPDDETITPTNPSLFNLEPVEQQLPVVVTATTLREVFDFWVQTCRTTSRPTPVMTDQRARVIGRAIRQYGVPTCKDAIVGVTRSEWHMGHNPRGKRYDDITLILRDAKHIEDFAALAHVEGWDARDIDW